MAIINRGDIGKIPTADHSWEITHWYVQAKGCLNRKVDKRKLRKYSWLRGTCMACLHFKEAKHNHHDSNIAWNYIHSLCTNERKEIIKEARE